MKRRYVYVNILLVLIALMLPCIFLKFGQYTQGRYTSVSQNRSILPQFEYLVPSFNELEKFLKYFSNNYSYLASLYELGEIEENGIRDVFPIYNMVLSTGYAKPIIVFFGGIYASDLSSPLTIMQCFSQWTTNIKMLSELLPLYDFHFIPLVNPAGYEFVYGKWKNGQSFSWLKNMRNFRRGKSVNIINNFDSNFELFTKAENDSHYGGHRPFSEPESRIVRDYIFEIQENIAAVFLLFSPSKNNAISYPFSHTMEKLDSWILQEQLVIQAIMASEDIPHSSIEVVSTLELDGDQGGRMDDWLIKTMEDIMVLNIQLCYTLKGTDNNDLQKRSNIVQSLMKSLVVGLYQDEYIGQRNHLEEVRSESYDFSWKKI